MKTDRSGRTFEEYRQLFWDEQKRVKELDGFITEYQKRELNFLERIAALELSNNGMHNTIARMTHRNGVECVHGKFLHEDCPKCRGEVK